MIRYALACDAGHPFESWFPSSASFEEQKARGLVSCPVCDSKVIDKQLMAPGLALSRARPVEHTPPREALSAVAGVSSEDAERRAMLRAVRDAIVASADDVGPRFAEEARKIHDGEAEERLIRGSATAEEARELADEGIEFHPLPVFPEDRN